MLKLARAQDPGGDYRLLTGDCFDELTGESCDLILSAFTFDNIPTLEKKVRLFRELKKLLAPEGKIINLVSSPDIYVHEWTSFTTRDFPENRLAKSGDRVKIVMKDVKDRRPVEDILWADDAYRKVYELAGLETLLMLKPLAKADEPYEWVNETKIAPWVIYVLKKRRE